MIKKNQSTRRHERKTSGNLGHYDENVFLKLSCKNKKVSDDLLKESILNERQGQEKRKI
jgi:hypothetical protein